jgi:OmpA-OmpF porin, OOP family
MLMRKRLAVLSAAAILLGAQTGRPVIEQYIVFFDFDRSDFSNRGVEVIHEAASNWIAQHKESRTSMIQVGGYTDTTLRPPEGPSISLERADRVAVTLESFGVPKSRIWIRDYGSTAPLVPTPEGQRQPENRRVEIILPEAAVDRTTKQTH